MNKTVEAWLKIWLYVMAAAVIVLVLILAVFWGRFDWITRLIFMTTITLVLHVWEEWRYPAGFAYMYNTLFKSERPDRYPMNQLTDMITNFGALLVFTGGLILFPGAVWIGTAMFLFCLMEVFGHTMFGIKMKNKFRDKGKRTIYNPGYATTMLGFLPIAAGFWYWLMAKHMAIWVDWIAGLAVSVIVFLALIVLPEALFRDEDSPYAFSDKYESGYFKKFMDET
jgi:hypothetical protein